MATTTGTNTLYDKVKEYLMDGTIDLDDHTFIVLLTTNVYVPDKANHSVLADITGEVSGSGYARQTLTGVQWVISGGANGEMKFDADNPQWSAVGGSITARYWVLYDDTPTTPLKPLIAYGLLDDTNQDVITTDGNTLTLNINANGFFTVS